jgi:hypothetical protein
MPYAAHDTTGGQIDGGNAERCEMVLRNLSSPKQLSAL